jgi:hypothetical protein
MAATAGHVLLTAWWVRRLDPDSRSRDERWFQATLVSVGSLSLVIHLVALTTGLSLLRGLAGLAVWHAGLAVVARDPVARGRRRDVPRRGGGQGRRDAGGACARDRRTGRADRHRDRVDP